MMQHSMLRQAIVNFVISNYTLQNLAVSFVTVARVRHLRIQLLTDIDDAVVIGCRLLRWKNWSHGSLHLTH